MIMILHTQICSAQRKKVIDSQKTLNLQIQLWEAVTYKKLVEI